MSYWSWLERISNAFLYPVYPAAVVELTSNPNTLVPFSYSLANVLSVPVNITVWGAIPSSPPWKGTVNLSCAFVGPLAPVVSNDLLNEPVHKLELGWPKKLSTLKSPAMLFCSVGTLGIGPKKLSLSLSFSLNLNPKNPFVL